MVVLVLVGLVLGAIGMALGWWLRGRAELSMVIKSEADAWQRARQWAGKFNGNGTRGGGLPW